MITFKINNTKTKVPTFNELTVNQIMEWNELWRNKKLTAEDSLYTYLITYLSVVHQKNYKEDFATTIPNIEILMNLIGSPTSYEKIKRNGTLMINGEVFNMKKASIQTVGDRNMIENNAKKLTNENYMCYVLAVAMSKENNANKINEIYKSLLDSCYIDVLGHAFFFSNSLMTGGRRETMLSKLVTRVLGMIPKNNRPKLID